MDHNTKTKWAKIPTYWLGTFALLYAAQAVGMPTDLHEGVFEAGVLLGLAVLVWPRPAPEHIENISGRIDAQFADQLAVQLHKIARERDEAIDKSEGS